MHLRIVVAALLFSAAALGAQAQDRQVLTLPPPSAALNEDEHARAILIAAPEVPSFVVLPLALPPDVFRDMVDAYAATEFTKLAEGDGDRRIVVTDVRAAVDKGEGRRMALVTLYKYDGHQTIERLVDLQDNTVARERISDTLTPALALIEHFAIRQLVRADTEIAEQLKQSKARRVAVEALVFAARDEDDPLYRHRTAEVQLSTEKGYAAIGQRLVVDLTENRLIKVGLGE